MNPQWLLGSSVLLFACGNAAGPPADPSAGISDGATLNVASKQRGIRISIDGVDRGPLPAEVHDLQPGEHKVAFGDGRRYAHTEKSIVVKGKETIDLGTIALKVLRGTVTFQLATPDAKVFLSCECAGQNLRKMIPQFPIKVEFDHPAEQWQLLAMKDGFEALSLPVNFDDGIADMQLTITLRVTPISP